MIDNVFILTQRRRGSEVACRSKAPVVSRGVTYFTGSYNVYVNVRFTQQPLAVLADRLLPPLSRAPPKP